MSAVRSPWQIDPQRYEKPRELYIRGTWAYAIGKPAKTHPKYAEACKRARAGKWSPWWIRSWSDVEAVLDECHFDQDAGFECADFFHMLRHSKGEWGGQEFHLADWQFYDVVMPLFGWTRDNGTRRFRRAYIEIPKKNGKTTVSSGFALYLLFWDGEPGAEVYSAAVDREQAGMVYQSASAMVRQSQDLADYLRCIDSRKRIAYQENNAFYAALSADVASKEGLNIHGVIYDELHVYPNRDMWDTLKYGGAARKQPLQIAITTAGVYDSTSLGWEQHDYALKVRDAKLGAHKDWAQFVYVCGLDEKDAEHWTSQKMWRKANPSWGITIREDEMRELCQVAQNVPTAQNDFKRYRLNIWTAQRSVWIDSTVWERLGGDYTEDDLLGRTCYGGLDLSLTQDVTASILWFPPKEEGEPHKFLEQFWIPEECIAKCDETHNGWYSLWRNLGYFAVTPGNVIDYGAVKAYILAQKKRYKIKNIGFDKWNATQLCLELENEGIEMLSVSQGFAGMTDATKRFADLVASGEIQHRRNPVFSWMLGNCSTISDTNGNIRVVKGEARGPGKGKIRHKVDGVIAAIMALGCAMLDAQKKSVYERRGLVAL